MELVDDVLKGSSQDDVHVVIRDTFDQQTLNNGVTLVRNTPMGHKFLDMLLEKVAYYDMFEADQGSFDAAVIEMLAIEQQSIAPNNTNWFVYRQDGDLLARGYDGECFEYLFSNIWRTHSVGMSAFCYQKVMPVLKNTKMMFF